MYLVLFLCHFDCKSTIFFVHMQVFLYFCKQIQTKMNIFDYIEQHSSPESDVLKRITRSTHLEVINPRMLSGHVQGRVLSMISQMIQPQRILELGTFTGYSALCLAEGLTEDGKLITIEHNDEMEPSIRRNLALTTLGEKIELVIGDAIEVLRRLDEKFDLIFIDADKKQYCDYLDLVIPLLRPGGWILASNTLMENGKIGRGKLSEEEWELLAKEYNKLAKKDNLFFYKPSRLTPEKLRTKAKQLQIQEGLDVIIVDHIGKLSSTLGDANSYVAMSDISNRLKSLALELKVCVIGLCQLSRAPEQRADHRPMLSDLRESGRLEEDADVIGFLYRDGYYQQRENGEDITEDVLEVDFQKCRNGRIGKAELHYNLATQRLSEMFGR